MLQAYSDKSRDYTIPEASLLASQVSGLPGAPAVWQNPRPGPMYAGNDFNTGGAVPAQYPGRQMAPWDTSMQASRPPFGSVPSTYPGQNFAASSVPAYATAAVPAGSSPHIATSQIPSAVSSMGFTPGFPPNVRPGGASSSGQLQQGIPPNVRPSGGLPPGHPTYYGQ